MRRSILVAILSVSVAGMLTACQILGLPFGSASTGCSPQLPASYRTQASVAVGILEVTVLDAAASPQPGVSVSAYWLGQSGSAPKARCPSMVQGDTDANGVLRWERLKTGPYELRFYRGNQFASVSATVVAGEVTRISLTSP